MYNGRTDLVEHVGYFNQRMVVHSTNETLMCKVFPSSLGPVVMRWFDGLRIDSIDSFMSSLGHLALILSHVPGSLGP